jgi:hypothetical protein
LPKETSSTSETPTEIHTVSTTQPTETATEPFDPPLVPCLDISSFQTSNGGKWFSLAQHEIPETQARPEAFFQIEEVAQDNREKGLISTALPSGYFFIQFDVSVASMEQYVDTVRAVFIRSALLSFVDYLNNRVLGWDRKSAKIPADVSGIIRVCNEKNIPVFLEINYSDYIPGELGSGAESLVMTDNVANTIAYLGELETQGLYLTGITFGDEIGDEAGYGSYKPTLQNTDLVSRFIRFAKGIKTAFPKLKILAFDSYIAATRGEVSSYWSLLQMIRQAEIMDGMILLDGFIFRESYVYVDENGKVLDSQLILDDTESLYRNTPVYRFDVFGNSHPNPDKAYLPEIINHTNEIFERNIEIGLSEYLPAVTLEMGEIDTSKYFDIDFILHYCDIVGIYAQLGLDYVSRMMFANYLDQHKSYFDREGNLGTNYPVQEQIVRYFSGEILKVTGSIDYSKIKVKVYVAKLGNEYFIMILNKDVQHEHTIQINVPGDTDLNVILPEGSYTSVIINDSGIHFAGIGNKLLRE